MFSSYSANEENKTFDELSSEECYEVISVPIWDFLWSLIIFLHFVVLGNIIYNVREGLGEGFISDWWQNFIPRNIQCSPWETWQESCVSSLIQPLPPPQYKNSRVKTYTFFSFHVSNKITLLGYNTLEFLVL